MNHIPRHALAAMGNPEPDIARTLARATEETRTAELNHLAHWKNILLARKLHVEDRQTTKMEAVEVVHTPKTGLPHNSVDLRVVQIEPSLVERAKRFFGKTKAAHKERGTGIDTRPATLESRQTGRRLRAERRAARLAEV